ncbi:hypothetical protein [Rhodoferax sp. BAB1]|uniref:hypothetical protein n=1 Tax=Rhodoferax sp. BAB1 TaxID=2741720 RepID=UPI0015768F98|nr:hypothetical protein [Rhodoferax sp. BAB1]QKO21087.1 hypothetical protein HTY51_03930 [Rhodoferax sp. BAB1]
MYLTWKRWLLLSFGLMSVWSAWAQPACERYELLKPKRGSQIADRQPELQWGGEANSSYRVQVAVVLPEGRVLESIDTVVTGTRWRLGAPVSVLTSAVKVIVSRNCSSYSVQDLHAQGPHFVIQATDQCTLRPQSIRQGADALHWIAPANSDKFVVQIFSMTQAADGVTTTQRLGGYEVVGISWKFPADLQAQLRRPGMADRSWVATVQARCGALLSHPQALVLDVSLV